MSTEITIHLDNPPPQADDRYFVVVMSWKTPEGLEFSAEIGIIDKNLDKKQLIKDFELAGNTSVKLWGVTSFADKAKYEAHKLKGSG